MKANQWVTMASFQIQARPSHMDMLLARREWLFHQQQEVRERLAALACQQHELRERQTIHELHWHVFWRRLRQSTDTPYCEETETVPAAELLIC